jgi:hypothetical protein
MKLIEKTRIGSKVIKKYDKPLTPYRRVLACADASEEDKQALRKLYANKPFLSLVSLTPAPGGK